VVGEIGDLDPSRSGQCQGEKGDCQKLKKEKKAPPELLPGLGCRDRVFEAVPMKK
jgi:hypothetical protein